MNKVLLGIVGIALIGCGKDQGGEVTPPVLAATPSFSWIQANILQASCVSCHSGGGAAMGVDLSSYEAMLASRVITPGSPDQSSLHVQIASGNMPKRAVPLSADKVEAVAEWIRLGALK